MRESPRDRTSEIGEAELATLLSGENGAYVESLFEDYLTGRSCVDPHWLRVFESIAGRKRPGDGALPRSNGGAATSPAPLSRAPSALARPHTGRPDSAASIGIFALVNAYRSHGHLIARLDPLGRGERSHPLLDPREFGIEAHQLGTPVRCGDFLGLREGTPQELIDSLRETYCGTFAVEFVEMRDKERRDWLVAQMEPKRNAPGLSSEERHRVLEQVLAAERLEQFLHKRFLGQKRFSMEGGEALIPLMDTIIEDAADLGAKEMVIAMAHRGRLNLMTHVLGMPYRSIFSEFQAGLVPVNVQGSGDVKYHRGFSADRRTRSGELIHLSLCPNPSHLEAINPVAEGIVRAKQNFRLDTERIEVIPLLIHGDAAFTGQGIVAETLALSELPTYWTGGTIHIIINNQIGFTTDPESYRFTRHPSDTAKVIQAPIFHVNADDPEACAHAARIAIAFRQRFREDVIIDLVCYRRHGHNESDDPTYTQPVLYKQIATHTRVADRYMSWLIEQGAISRLDAEKLEAAQQERMERALEESRIRVRVAGAEGYHGLWEGHEARYATPESGTAITREQIAEISNAFISWPDGFQPHPKLKRLMEERSKTIDARGSIDWGTGEALAIGSLLLEGTTVRLTGQDVERGTFSHRHGVLHDVETGDRFMPLAELARRGANFILSNSLLSEAAVLGFEYGYSTVDPNRLAIWEAQFGDFANSAQIIVDQFIASAEQKWNRSSGLVMLLPHGYEGQGPEHSSARLERFLQLCAEDNMQVCNLTTPGQLFHGLRRQIHRGFRKPLVIMSPKSLLRHPLATSTVAELETGAFQEIIDDPARLDSSLDPQSVRRVLICSGKLYYTLVAARTDNAFDDVAILRLEQLHPFPFEELTELLAGYASREVAWVQEEPWNMGAWTYVQERIRRVVPRGARLRYIGRPESASPAVGNYRIHEQEEAEVVREAFSRRSRKRRAS